MYKVSLIAMSELALQYLYLSQSPLVALVGAVVILPTVVKAWKGIDLWEEIELEAHLGNN